MKIGTIDALLELCPDAEFVLSDGKIVEWHSPDIVQPLGDEIDAKIRELQQLEPYRLLRVERDRLLKETDWRASSDRVLPESWRAYRQALRDLPANAKPKLDENDNLDMSSVAWPSPST